MYRVRGLLVLCGTGKNETSLKASKGKTDFFFFKSTFFLFKRRGEGSLLTHHVESVSVRFYMFSLDVAGPTVHLFTVVLWYTRIL